MKHKNQAMWGIVLAATLLQSAVFAEDKKVSHPEEVPAELPNVFIIGDSISIGYTERVRTLLKGKANVSRPPGNCAHSGVGVKNVQAWLGKTKWDVIHFNFGIWDTHCLHNGSLVSDRSKYKTEDLKRRHTTEQYVENLGKIVAILKKTGAKLIWASTTPYVSYGEDTKLLVETNNKAATAVAPTQQSIGSSSGAQWVHFCIKDNDKCFVGCNFFGDYCTHRLLRHVQTAACGEFQHNPRRLAVGYDKDHATL